MLAATVPLLVLCLTAFGHSRALADDRCRSTATTSADRAACIRATCAGLAGKARLRCERSCRPAPVRTLAYAVVGCREDPRGLITARHEVRIRRGDCPPVTVFSATTEAPDPLGDLCRAFGEARDGNISMVGGVISRIGMTRDGAQIAFEVTDDFSIVSPRLVSAEREGMYLVRADGSGLRRLGPASRDPSFRLVAGVPGAPLGILPKTRPLSLFSPNGRRLVFSDRGPGPGGEDAVQLVMLDVDSGRRVQLTRLPPAAPPAPEFDVVPWRFLDEQTVLFYTFADADGAHPEGGIFRVRIDGTGLQAIPTPVPSGGQVVPSFEIAGGPRRSVVNLVVPGVAANPGGLNGSTIFEAFVVDGDDLLQLTAFGRRDTFAQLLSVDQRHVFLRASADPLGENPSENCQLFSIDTLGVHLRQITHLGEGERSMLGCDLGLPPGCDAQLFMQDPVTQTIVFYSGCDPVGENPYGGQIFAMRPDGSGLRQLTDARGLVIEADGTVDTELPGPFWYSGRRF